jgi:glycosyltransferase involved in cell wall biosynthesis
MRYSIVIPTYNHCEDLLKPCLESIFKFTDMADVELVISANGCTDGTQAYLQELSARFASIGFDKHIKVVWSDQPLGYSGACNAGIVATRTDRIVLLNNDTVLLPQNKSQWLDMLNQPFAHHEKCGISCVIKGPSEPAGRDFAVFFCVMIRRSVFNRIGLLNTEYGIGGGEDTEFCIQAEMAGFEVHECSPKEWSGNQFTGAFPIYHKGEGTMLDTSLVPDYNDVFLRNSLKLAKKFNPDWYRWRLSNYWERAVFLKGDPVFPREVTRYQWAAQHVRGKSVFELGCSSGYGVQFMPDGVEYTGLDYDQIIVDVAKEQGWSAKAQFVHADINKYDLQQYDTIIAFEVIEHLDNGLEVLQKLKQHCKTLLFTVPMNEPVGFWGPHHKLHGLNESHFPGFEFNYIDEQGNISAVPKPIDDQNRLNLLIGRWHA